MGPRRTRKRPGSRALPRESRRCAAFGCAARRGGRRGACWRRRRGPLRAGPARVKEGGDSTMGTRGGGRGKGVRSRDKRGWLWEWWVRVALRQPGSRAVVGVGGLGRTLGHSCRAGHCLAPSPCPERLRHVHAVHPAALYARTCARVHTHVRTFRGSVHVHGRQQRELRYCRHLPAQGTTCRADTTWGQRRKARGMRPRSKPRQARPALWALLHAAKCTTCPNSTNNVSWAAAQHNAVHSAATLGPRPCPKQRPTTPITAHCTSMPPPCSGLHTDHRPLHKHAPAMQTHA